MTRVHRAFVHAARCFGLGALSAVGSGCGIDLSGSILVTPTNGGPAPDTVTIVFRNLTETDAVDVQFYASNAVLQNVTQELFVDANKITTSVGVAGTGIIEPGEGDVTTLPCATDLSLGTAGGLFLDNETGEEQGRGTMRWAQERPLGLCGGIVRIEFDESGGAFITTIRLLDVEDVVGTGNADSAP